VDEQKARFNAIGRTRKDQQRTARSETQNQQADCGGEKAGLTALPIERIEEVGQPSVAQAGALDRLTRRWTRQCRCCHPPATTIPLTPSAGLGHAEAAGSDDRGRQHRGAPRSRICYASLQ